MSQTGSQTVGPFFSFGLLRGGENVLVSDATKGERVRIEGTVFDGENQPVPDALIEIWQANSHGRYHHPEDKQEKPLDPEFRGFGRCGTDEKGVYWFETIKPGPVPGPDDSAQAPHINVIVFARGMLLHVFTRIYFADAPENRSDPILSRIEDPERRATLLARREPTGGKILYRFDIYLQGRNETVFFDM
jgi:protocatechuate 3,4-dioxygenase, alpha subunit